MEGIAITDEQRKYAWRLVNSHNFAKRGRFNGRMQDQYAGKLGEVVFADVFEHPRPVAVPYDHGVDFVVGDKNVDLKTTHSIRSPEKSWYTNVVADQRDGFTTPCTCDQIAGHHFKRITDVYLFAHINEADRTFHLIGWARPAEYIMGARHVNVGDSLGGGGSKAWRETWNVRHDRLKPWFTYDHFSLALSLWGK